MTTVSTTITNELLSRLNEEIAVQLVSQVPLVGEVAQYTIDSGGKRLRPVLLLLSAGSLGCKDRRAVQLAAAIEFVHTATLLHDDVVDSSAVRRGKQTANERFGNAAAVLVGDFLYSRAFQIMVDVGESRIFRIMADATNDISEGEVLQLSNVKNVDLTVDSYFEMIRSKTARLFEAAVMLGGIIAGGEQGMITNLGKYGAHIGTAFQIVDDILDYDGSEGEIGKKLGDDLAEGKITLPMIHALEHGSIEDVTKIRAAIFADGAADLDSVVDIFRRLDSLEYSRRLAKFEINSAENIISSLPKSRYKDCMVELAANSLSRIS
ncbi:MAG: polyprenyl synthetase family protein [Proteobacteria bacterium]|nr:polyprenyl synthetase family protein [Pseudomonadota bacterium]MDA0861602.1 polyprenyl synthetase family protein [Pseudomonadota bacterium]